MAVQTKFQVEVSYNGVTKALQVEAHEQVEAILQQAIHLFQITQQPHLLSLFRLDGSKVDEHQSAAQAGLQQGTELFLRPDAVKGGA